MWSEDSFEAPFSAMCRGILHDVLLSVVKKCPPQQGVGASTKPEGLERPQAGVLTPVKQTGTSSTPTGWQNTLSPLWG